MTFKVAIIGPGRSKQGTGPFIARTFDKLGCNVCAVVSSSLSSANTAVDALKKDFDISCKAYDDFDLLLKDHAIDIVAISSPVTNHYDYLQAAIKAEKHIFCEKPLWWPSNNITSEQAVDDITSKTIAMANECNTKRLVLQLNTQWPYTLPAFYELHPQLKLENTIDTFSMWLAPQSEGETMLVDTISHPLSMLYTLVGAGKVNNIQSNFHQLQAGHDLQIGFEYLHARGDTRVSISLSPSETFPKPAAYAINGLRVDRHVELPNYLISLHSSDMKMPVVDPLESSIKNFISSIHSKATSDEVALIDGVTHLAEIYLAVTQPKN